MEKQPDSCKLNKLTIKSKDSDKKANLDNDVLLLKKIDKGHLSINQNIDLEENIENFKERKEQFFNPFPPISITP